ncbi:sugar phosphate isomerase/epimerase family protein [Rhizomonospora bruguierae]|uniref:sugar phosphate isomerase/epimerase family protein n=1 Tax=Rhizomonospora bruguierae TaxID=1581705 RepID=UPI001BD0865A|nr:sugar phosphate isomerase/epimerase family protein [Micromonospora sp. NBRC 107566]
MTRFSVCQLGLPGTSFDEDVALCAELGIGLGADESKFPEDENAAAAALADAGVPVTIACPATLTLLPSPAVSGGPTYETRLAQVLRGIRRLAVTNPATVFVITGPAGDLGPERARAMAVEGLREAARVAKEVGVTLSVEIMRTSYADEWTFVHTIADGLQLIEDVDPDLRIILDTWHMWDSPGVLPMIEKHADVIAGVQLSDYRLPFRANMDRILPGDGVIDLPAMVRALERGGFTGWYDLEIFSDPQFPDSLWRRPQRAWVSEGRQKFAELCGIE